MLKRVVKNGSQIPGNATSQELKNSQEQNNALEQNNAQELRKFWWHTPGPLEGSGFTIGKYRFAPCGNLTNTK